MIIYLIRHGQSTGDIENLFGGDYDDHLTERGKEQAKELSERLSDKKIEKIFCSPKIRARETGEELRKKLRCDLEVIDGIKERNRYGVYSGRNKDLVRKEHPEIKEILKDYKKCLEGGETYTLFKKRLFDSIKSIIAKDYKIVAVVSHGGPIKLILRELFNKQTEHIEDCGYHRLDFNDIDLSL